MIKSYVTSVTDFIFNLFEICFYLFHYPPGPQEKKLKIKKTKKSLESLKIKSDNSYTLKKNKHRHMYFLILIIYIVYIQRYTKFDIENMTYAKKINQNRINVMIDFKTVADFEITTADMFSTHESEGSRNYTHMYEETTENHVETASKCFFFVFFFIDFLNQSNHLRY